MRGYASPVVSEGRATVGGTTVSIENIRLDRVLGSGANGFVFAGEDLLLKRRVAVKVWPPRKERRRAGEDRTEQALAEARKLAQLDSDVIAPVYQAGRLENGWIYIVMKYIEGDPLKKVRASLNDAGGFARRMMYWSDVRKGLGAAESIGIYHGDVHDKNVIVDFFHATLIDFGTSVLKGKGYSLERHARLVNEFAQGLLPELTNYIAPFDIPNLVPPQYTTYAVNQWVEAARSLQELDKLLPGVSEEDLARRLRSLASSNSTTLIDIKTAVVEWLTTKGVSPESLQVYTQCQRL
jgi:serine/threonine protein kinase